MTANQLREMIENIPPDDEVTLQTYYDETGPTPLTGMIYGDGFITLTDEELS